MDIKMIDILDTNTDTDNVEFWIEQFDICIFTFQTGYSAFSDGYQEFQTGYPTIQFFISFFQCEKKKKNSPNIISADNRIFNRYPEFSDMDTYSKITDNTDTDTNILKNLEYPFCLQAYVQGPCSFQVTVALSINYVVTFGQGSL